MDAEEASRLTTRAICADLESWAMVTADLAGLLPLLDLLRVLDQLRETTEA